MRRLVTARPVTSDRWPRTLVREWHRLACCASATSGRLSPPVSERSAEPPRPPSATNAIGMLSGIDRRGSMVKTVGRRPSSSLTLSTSIGPRLLT